MTSFNDRGKAFENKFFHDEEMRFKVISRRRKLLGLWAAENMHLSEEDSLAYALDIVRLGVEDTSEGAIVKKILKDMKDVGLETTEEEVRRKMEKLHGVAEQLILKQYQDESE